MTDFIEFSGKLLLVFAASFALCWLSACNAIKEQTEEDWKSLTAEERANDRIRNYVAQRQCGKRIGGVVQAGDLEARHVQQSLAAMREQGACSHPQQRIIRGRRARGRGGDGESHDSRGGT